MRGGSKRLTAPAVCFSIQVPRPLALRLGACDMSAIVGPLGKITGVSEDGDCILWVDGAGDDYFLDLNNPTDVMTAIKLIGFQ